MLKKRQHYVPQSYLEQFTPKNDSKIYVYNKIKKQFLPEKSNIINFAQEKYFYDFDFQKELKKMNINPESIDKEILDQFKNTDKQFIENYFSDRVENRIIPTIKEITQTPDIIINNNSYEPFNEKNKVEVAFYIIFQIIRTKSYREKIKRDLILKGHTRVEIDMKARLKQILKIADISGITEEARLLCNRYSWLLVMNRNKTKFCTSDNPVIFNQDLYLFPISPCKAIMLIDAKIQNGGYIAHNDKVTTITEKGVRKYNKFQVKQAERHVFCSEKNRFY